MTRKRRCGMRCVPLLAIITVLSPALADEPAPLAFTPIDLPMTNEAKHGFAASSSALVHGKSHPVGYQTIARVGDQIGDGVFGQLIDVKGAPMVDDDGAPELCHKPDFMTLIPVGSKLFMINQFECSPAAMYLTELEQDQATGELSALSTRPIDFSGVNGGIRHCAGMLTPWNTHLSSEEDIRDARKLQPDGTIDHDNYRAMIVYLGDEAEASPYLWGWVPEVAILNEAGATSVVKHYAMGRLSAEIAYVLPDERTVFVSEDNTNSPLVMFVADQPSDLSAGMLYAAKWTQTNDQGAGAGDLQWINLGHANNDEIANEPSKASGNAPALFSISSQQQNAETTSLRLDMRQLDLTSL